MKKAAIFVHRYSKKIFGGVERVVSNIISRMKNIEWHIYCWNLYNEKHFQELNKIKIHRLNFHKNELLKLRELKKIFLDNPDFVWVNDIIPTARISLINPEIFSTLHASHLHFIEVKTDKKWRIRRYLEKFVLKRVENVSAVSKFLIDFYYGLGIKDLEYTPNGIDFKKLKTFFTKEKKDYIVFIGTLCERKGIKELLTACKNVKTKLYLIGEIPKGYSWIRDCITKTKNVKYLGYLNEDEKMKILSQSKALVLPSYDEGFGLTILESLVVGTPVITTKVGVAPEIFEKYDAGIMLKSLPPDENELAIAMKEMIEREYNPKKLQKIAKKYDWNKVIKYWKRFLK